MPASAVTSSWLESLALLQAPSSGVIDLASIDSRSLDRPAARERIALVGPPETFAGTIAENLRVGREHVTAGDLRQALDAVGLSARISRLPLGMATRLDSDGYPLDPSESARLSLARAMAGHPGLLLIDRTLDGLDLEHPPGLATTLFDSRSPWTLIVATSRDDVRSRCHAALEAP